MSTFLTDPEKKVLGVSTRLAQRFNTNVKSVRLVWLVLGIIGVLSLGGPLLIVLLAYMIMFFVLDPNPFGNLPKAMLLKASIATAIIGILVIVIESQQGYNWHNRSKIFTSFHNDELIFYTGVIITAVGAFGVLFTYKGKAD